MTQQIHYSNVVKARVWSERASLLECPCCGSEYLHHAKVTIFDRGEDAETVVRTEVQGSKLSVNPLDQGQGNPSSRRDGVTVDFWCEGCGASPITLTIGQHKGMTEIGWVHGVKS